MGMSATDMAHRCWWSGGVGPISPQVSDRPGQDRSFGCELGELGVVPGQGWLTFGQTDGLDRLEIDQDVILDADGNVGVVERSTVDDRTARTLLDTYLLGDARQSAAAAAEESRESQGVFERPPTTLIRSLRCGPAAMRRLPRFSSGTVTFGTSP